MSLNPKLLHQLEDDAVVHTHALAEATREHTRAVDAVDRARAAESTARRAVEKPQTAVDATEAFIKATGSAQDLEHYRDVLRNVRVDLGLPESTPSDLPPQDRLTLA
jgi:hypothetical protein